MLGRAFHDHDALFDTIEKWRMLADSDRSIAA